MRVLRFGDMHCAITQAPVVKVSWKESKPDSVLSASISRNDICRLGLIFIRLPSSFGTTPLKRGSFGYQSEVAAGRIARFTPTRLCCSQALSIQDLFLASHVGKEAKTPVISDRSLRSIPGFKPVWTFLSDFLDQSSGPSSQDIGSISPLLPKINGLRLYVRRCRAFYTRNFCKAVIRCIQSHFFQFPQLFGILSPLLRLIVQRFVL